MTFRNLLDLFGIRPRHNSRLRCVCIALVCIEVARTIWSKEGRSEQRMSHKGVCGRVGEVNPYGL